MKIRSVLSIALLLSLALSAMPLAAAAKPLPDMPSQDCMPVYREYDFGAVRYVSRDTCHAEIYVNGQKVWPPVAASAAPVETCLVGDADCVGMSSVAKCVLLVYVADYQWTYLCVEPKDASCAVYVKRVVGVTETRTCVGAPVAPAEAATCYPTSGGMDYHSYLCVEPKNAGCFVYTESSTDNGVKKTCVGLLAPACLDMYWDAELGPVRVESRNSCHRQVYVFGQPVF